MRIYLLAILFFNHDSSAQTKADSILHKWDVQKWSASVSKKANRLEEKIIHKSEKTLHQLQSQEERIYRKMLQSKDSLEAKAQLEKIRSQYAGLREKMSAPSLPSSGTTIREYIPRLDTLYSAFKFLDKAGAGGNIAASFSQVQSLNERFQQASDIKDFIGERKQELKQQLERFGLLKDLKKFNKQAYYYGEQIKEYRAIISDPKKAERKALALLSKTRLFQDFMRKNSLFASLFRAPAEDPTDPAYLASLAGLQTRVQVNTLIRQQIASGGPNAMQQVQQNFQEAGSQLAQLKAKVNQWGGGNSDDIMPEGFKPNTQKSKSFLKRLEYGTNFQSQKATSYFPVTTDIGLTLGYKINDRSIIGIGASYKVGWGRGWNNINFSSQGAGLRSFIDWKLKGSFYITGGYEKNYRSVLRGILISSPLGGGRQGWQESGLLGLSKTVSVKSKFFKKTKLQLLWDFLSYRQVPLTQPVVFRIGYNIN